MGLIDFIKKALSTAVSSDDFREVMKDLMLKIKDMFPDVDMKKAETLIKIAWNYEERNQELFTFEEAIKWIKGNFNQEKHSAGCLLKRAQEKEETILLDLCFLDKDKQSLMSPSDKHLHINALKLDDELKKHFSNKEMIIFQ